MDPPTTELVCICDFTLAYMFCIKFYWFYEVYTFVYASLYIGGVGLGASVWTPSP